ncbi:MAG: hypothetical protein ACI9SC_003186, partial [Gammaproteobacteria bacterium]
MSTCTAHLVTHKIISAIYQKAKGVQDKLLFGGI